jgi:undecaprenyl diphosphate synthase
MRLETKVTDVATKLSASRNGQVAELEIPRHVAIIMDGNARWAGKNGLSIAQGHRAGYENIEKVARGLAKRGVEEATLFAFSTENWNRPEDEVQALMDLASEAIERGVEEFHANGIKLRHVGYERRLPSNMLHKIKQAEHLTRDNSTIALNLAFDYGGRHEIVNAVKKIVADGVEPDAIDEATIEQYLFTAGTPDPDIVIRTGGEFRISNFMIWQSAYSEFYSSPALWPEFGETEIDEAIKVYSQRQRRFGQRPA